MKKLLLSLLLLGFSPVLLANDCPADKLFVHEKGSTCIVDKPKRIVVLEYSFLDQLAVLNIKPVGYTQDVMPKYLEPYANESINLGARKMPSLEKMISLKPDLIIADKRLHANMYTQLSVIAPTIVRNGMRGGIEDQFATLRQVAKIVGKIDEAEFAIRNTQQRMLESKNKSINKKTVVGVFRPGSISAHGSESFLGSFIESVGKTVPLKTRSGNRQYYLDLEGLAAVNPEALVLMCSKDAQQALNDMLKNPLFGILKAVKHQHLYIVPKTLWSKGRGILGINEILNSAADTGFLAHRVTDVYKCLD